MKKIYVIAIVILLLLLIVVKKNDFNIDFAIKTDKITLEQIKKNIENTQKIYICNDWNAVYHICNESKLIKFIEDKKTIDKFVNIFNMVDKYPDEVDINSASFVHDSTIYLVDNKKRIIASIIIGSNYLLRSKGENIFLVSDYNDELESILEYSLSDN